MTFSSFRLSPMSARFGARIERIGEARQVERRARRRVLEQRPAETELVADVHVRLVGGAAAVERIQVEPRRPEVDQRVGVVLLHQARRGIERDVVVDELAQVGVAGGDARILLVVLQALRRVLEGGRGERGVGLVTLRFRRHRLAELQEALAGEVGGGQRAEHPPEGPFELGRARNGVVAANAAAVRGRLPLPGTDHCVNHERSSSGVAHCGRTRAAGFPLPTGKSAAPARPARREALRRR